MLATGLVRLDITNRREVELTFMQDKGRTGTHLEPTTRLRGHILGHAPHIFVLPRRRPTRHNLLGLEPRWETRGYRRGRRTFAIVHVICRTLPRK